MDWSIGQHKDQCGSQQEASNESTINLGFRMSELISEQEDYAEKSREEMGDVSAAMMPASLMKPLKLEDAGCTDLPVCEEDYEEVDARVDKTFRRFQKRIRHDPDQVLRYARIEDQRNPDPLWVNAEAKPNNIPACPCGQPRTFEFQIMPQLLQHLGIDHSDPDSLDFGSLMIYSCAESCDYGSTSYHEEYIWSQPFSTDGLQQQQKCRELPKEKE
jgi:pre-rRNA-processing protein TSR4